MKCQACDEGDHQNCGMQTWCDCPCDGTDSIGLQQPKLKAMCCYTGVKPVFMCDDCPARNDFVGKVKPHAYVPSTMHRGDCAICGHVQESPLHDR